MQALHRAWHWKSCLTCPLSKHFHCLLNGQVYTYRQTLHCKKFLCSNETGLYSQQKVQSKHPAALRRPCSHATQSRTIAGGVVRHTRQL